MRRIFPLFILLIFSSLLFLIFSFKSFATFNEVYLRLDRQSTSTATTGLICAKPNTSGTENSVQVTFPTGFTVSTTTGDWTVATTSLPSGATAWPGIGTATAASGQVVTFPSSDLSTSTLYCFRWTNSAALTTAGSTGENYSGTITTKDSGNSTIDTSNFGLALVSADQLTVSARVAANPTDFQANLSSSTTGSPFAQNSTIDYQLNYGSYLLYPSNLTLEAEWTLGTIEGSSSPSVEIIDYVIGSASNAYGSTAPVVDLVNKKISWSISNFPANTVDQTVSFKLKTNSSYTGSKQVNFSAKGRVLGPGTQTADSTVTKGYKYVSSATPTATPTNTPTPGPTATPGATTTPTPTPTTAPSSAPGISHVEMRTISATEATVFVQTSTTTSLTIDYGASPGNLNQTLKDLTSASEHLLKLAPLEAQTGYYFKITVVNEAGLSTTSDLFTFTTALSSQPTKIDLSSIVISSSDVILSAPKPEAKDQIPIVILPKGTGYSFHFYIKDFKIIDRIKMIVRNKNTLGINTFDQETSSSGVEITELGDGVYEGRLRAPLANGIYELYAQIFDKNGNLSENLIANIQVVNHFTVLEKGTSNPIEAARVFLYIYNSRTQLFNPILSNTLSIENPTYTNSQGEITSPLPLGKYKAEILAIGYKPKEVIFTLDTSNFADKYPKVYLEKLPFSLTATSLYFAAVSLDVLDQIRGLIQTLSNSVRFFDLITISTLISFIYLTTLAFSWRIKIPLHSLSYYLHHRQQVTNLDAIHKLVGVIYNDKTKQPVAGAEVFLIEKGGIKILARTTSNAKGEFSFKKLPNVAYHLQIMQEDYEPKFFDQSDFLDLENTPLPFYIHQHLHKGFTIAEKLKLDLKNIVGVLFESFLISSFSLELIIGYSLSWLKVLPFLVLSFINLLIWLDHLFYRRTAVNE